MDRKLIHSSEKQISFLQIIGFLVILFGLIYLFFEQITGALNGESVAIDFFTIMLGFSFAFPDLLRDSNKGLSTMRIVVFMMINVICMLLLKIGWDVKSLRDIGLDQYWMGVIAFVFGAKATQSYFESKLAVPGVVGGGGGGGGGGAVGGGAVGGGAVGGGAVGGGAVGGGAVGGGAVAGGAAGGGADDEIDGCGITPATLTADADLPVTKGGIA